MQTLVKCIYNIYILMINVLMPFSCAVLESGLHQCPNVY